MNRALHILRKELTQFARDKRMRTMVMVAPVLQLFMFAYVVSTDVKHIRVAVCDLDRTPASRAVTRTFVASDLFEVVINTDRPAELLHALDRGDALLSVRIDPGFDRSIRRGETPSIQLLVDGTESQTAQVAAGYTVASVGGAIAKRVVETHRLSAAPGVSIVPRVWFNPDLDSRIFNLPGVLVLVLMVTTMILSSMAIVKEREVGTIEQLIVTPIRPLELIAGKTLPFAAVGMVAALAVTNVAVWLLGLPFRGSVFVLLLGIAAFLLSTLGLGIFISTLARTQQQAMMTALFVMFPGVLLSGFVFPLASMPQWAQVVSHLNPLRYFLSIVRGVFLRGSDLSVLWPQFVGLLAFGALILTFSALRFQKRLA
jgi:ABC-2 type transport system permease protein